MTQEFGNVLTAKDMSDLLSAVECVLSELFTESSDIAENKGDAVYIITDVFVGGGRERR